MYINYNIMFTYFQEEMLFKKKFQRKSNTQYKFSNFFFAKILPFVRKCGKYCRYGKDTEENIANAQILMNLEFYRQIFEKYQTPDFMYIRSFVAELLHLGRRTNRQTFRSYSSLFAILRTNNNTIKYTENAKHLD